MSRFAPHDAPFRRFLDQPVTHGFVFACWIAYGATLLLGGVRSGGAGMGGLLAPSSDALQSAGWLDPKLVIEHGEWERFASSILLHGGLLHIVFNSSALLQLG